MKSYSEGAYDLHIHSAPDVLARRMDANNKKVEAMKSFKAQSHLIVYYIQRAFMGGSYAANYPVCQEFRYAESFARVFPVVSTGLL